MGDAPPSSGIYICLRYGALELRVRWIFPSLIDTGRLIVYSCSKTEFVARLFPFIIVIRHHV
ncbi:hypothetical protein BS47DRAFT_1354129 [Hydnum rufescens UP504]|uniref:Uncharacterized protein n=1 Tax=Hydnum rufescens UP504 TaxID=1448309 RepID=A0A9P6AGC6_9AGAM|nr:hypothetical protein BS47DRAFT_1354129 [Hydnum rufescens UP504]